MRVLILCHDLIGPSMAGPAIRCWEFAKQLGKIHQVTLMGKVHGEVHPEGFTLVPYSKWGVWKAMGSHDVMITQLLRPLLWLRKCISSIRVIIDAYDPMPLENLEIFKDETPFSRIKKNAIILAAFRRSFKKADGVICANELQRDLWIGFLMGLKRITPSLYDQDPTLRAFIDIVPFGLSSAPPVKSGPGFKSRYGLPSHAKVVLWGGGIWNWFDPLTAIRAIHLLQQKRSDIYLIFMGIKHPNPGVPAMRMAADAIAQAKELDLFDKHVFFNTGWIPYHDRHNYLLEADIGISTHFLHLETRYAFRTRMLDYIWASLPIVASEGDYFAKWIAEKRIGRAVPCENPVALAQAIEDLIDRPDPGMKARLAEAAQTFTWEQVIKPLQEMIDAKR